MRRTTLCVAVTLACVRGAALPPWPQTWNMSLSTAFMPCYTEGIGPVPFPPEQAARWGLADFDCACAWESGIHQ